MTSAIHPNGGTLLRGGTLIRVGHVASGASNRLYASLRNSALYGVGLGYGIKKSFREPLKLQREVGSYMLKHLPSASALHHSNLPRTCVDCSFRCGRAQVLWRAQASVRSAQLGQWTLLVVLTSFYSICAL